MTEHITICKRGRNKRPITRVLEVVRVIRYEPGPTIVEVQPGRYQRIRDYRNAPKDERP